MTYYQKWTIRDEYFRQVVEEAPERIVCLDTETTGLDPQRDGIISLSIVDLYGNPMFDSLIHTYRKTVWPEAYRINRISPRDVRDAPSVPQIRDEVESVLSEAEIIVGYNHTRFDLPMMESNGFNVPRTVLFDVFNQFYNTVGDGGRHRLADCAAYCCVDFDEAHRAHTSLGDAAVTMECALRLTGIAGGDE